jgi:hypothetical protein
MWPSAGRGQVWRGLLVPSRGRCDGEVLVSDLVCCLSAVRPSGPAVWVRCRAKV